ncbi:calcium/calmodulin-dependent protein kinase type IV-like protein [Powellomyces hirtus]|nr:calcium/calmodulin-dependent protein kinase type IV-like protein [Powellomyces hirtus]
MAFVQTEEYRKRYINEIKQRARERERDRERDSLNRKERTIMRKWFEKTFGAAEPQHNHHQQQQQQRQPPRIRGGRFESTFEQQYFVGRQLGVGTFAVVKECTRKSDSSKFAVKIIDKSQLTPTLSTLRTEVDVLKRITHPNIISLCECFENYRNVYLVTELATGGELFDRILNKGSFSEQDASRLVMMLLRGVAYLHRENIAHRDLKPENLLFRGPDDDADLMITDFGLSKIIPDGAFLQTACGTPHYVAPEILRQNGHGKPVDMWAVGVITYVLLCGYTPFYGGESQSNAGLFQAILECNYLFDDEYWAHISPAAKEFIQHLLVLDPANRATADMALQHPWLQTRETADILPDLKKGFNAKRTFKRAFIAISSINRAAKAAQSTQSLSFHSLPPAAESPTSTDPGPSTTIQPISASAPAETFIVDTTTITATPTTATNTTTTTNTTPVVVAGLNP